MMLPTEVRDLIVDKSDWQALKALSVTCKGLSFRSQYRILERLLFWGHSGPCSLSAWLEEKPEFQKRAEHVKAILYIEEYDSHSYTDHEKLLSSFVKVETLRLEMADLHVRFAPRFTALKAVRFLSLHKCSMNIRAFRYYLRSFPLLEFLSISLPSFDPKDVVWPPPITQDLKRDARQVALHLKSITPTPSGPLLRVLSSVAFAFTGIRLDSCLFVPRTLSSFLESKKGAVTVIGVNSESPLPTPLSFSRNFFLRKRSDFA